MSSLKVHTIQSLATSAALYPLMGENVVPFALAVVFIDIDHVFGYVKETKSPDVRGVFPYCKLIETNLDKNFLVLNILHTVEFFALVLAMAVMWPVWYYVLAGLLYHMLFDVYHLKRLNRPFGRVYSLIEYMYRTGKREYITSVRELIKTEGVETAEVKDIKTWLGRWNFVQEES